MAGNRTPRPRRVKAKPAARPTKKSPKPATWKPIDHERIQDAITHLFHFTSRPINTNADPVGIRISPARRSDTPLVGVSTLPSGVVPLDYVRGAQDSGLAKQIAAIAEPGDAALFQDIPEADAAFIKESLGVLAGHAEFGTGRLDTRLPQVLWPLDPENPSSSDYVALTPLPSTGLAALVGRRANAIVEQAREKAETTRPKGRYRYFERTKLEYGGTKTHNVARHARAMQRPLVFSAPRSNKSTRRVWRVHFQGMSWLSARAEIDDWLNFRRRRLNTGGTQSDMRSRTSEVRLIERIARATLRRAGVVENRLLDELGLEPGELLDADLDSDTRALVDRSLRTSDWPARFGKRLLQVLAHADFTHRKGTMSLGLSDADALILSSIAEGVAR